MDASQLHAAVAEFLHVLATDPKVFAQWQQTEKNPAAMGALIQKTLKLDAAPSAETIAQMSEYGHAQLSAHVETLKSLSGGQVRQCGNIFGTTHS
ncbi:MAG: hypothetical protein NVS9B12_02970 [Vulcanimicrobiaceae bacterium]